MDSEVWDEQLIENKLQLAILYFKSKDFQQALKTYNGIIRHLSAMSISRIKSIRTSKYKLRETPLVGPIIHPKLGSALDQRSATYEKLGQIERALKDGRELVKLEPISCKGYLRVGKLELAKGNEIVAYKCYQKGISTIKKAIEEHKIEVPAKLFQSLNDKYTKLNRELKARTTTGTSQSTAKVSSSTLSSQVRFQSASQASVGQTPHVKLASLKRTASMPLPEKKRLKATTDPMVRFPPEIIQLIFETLSLKNLVTCHLVSKRWYSQLTGIPALYINRIQFRPSITVNEFTAGVSVIKKILRNTTRKLESFKIRSTINSTHLHRILSSIITEPNFPLGVFELYDTHFNFQLFLSVLIKASWRLNNFGRIESLKLGLNSSLRYDELVLTLFKRLRVISIVVLSPEMSGRYNELVPANDIRLRKLMASATDTSYESLESLTLVNHPMLIRREIMLPAKWDTYNPYPPFLKYQFPNLTELTLASFDFHNRLPRLGELFLSSPKLRTITLENNCNFSLVEFFQMLNNYNPQFRLEKLVFREDGIKNSSSLNEFVYNDLSQLQSLNYLDLTGCSLTSKGLIKLLTIIGGSRSSGITTLMIGNSPFLKFKTDTFHAAGSAPVLSLYDILMQVPRLEKLYLNDLELDTQSMKQFHNDLQRFGVENLQLKLLDLSFTKVEGLGLIELFGAYSFRPKPTNSHSMPNQASPFGRARKKAAKTVTPVPSSFKLHSLIIDGIEISKSTLDMLVKYELVQQFQNNATKPRWRQFGTNSLVIS